MNKLDNTIVIITLAIVLNLSVFGYIKTDKDGLKELAQLVGGGLIGFVTQKQNSSQVNSEDEGTSK